MKFITWIRNTLHYLLNGVSILFRPTDDDYPKTGIQPYTGDPDKDK